MLQLHQHFSIISIVDGDRIPNKTKKLLADLAGRFPQIFEQHDKSEIEKFIHVLSKQNLESYFEKVPGIIADWLEIDMDETKEILNANQKSMTNKLSYLGRKYKDKFDKIRDLPLFAEKMTVNNIDPEIIRLFQQIQEDFK